MKIKKLLAAICFVMALCAVLPAFAQGAGGFGGGQGGGGFGGGGPGGGGFGGGRQNFDPAQIQQALLDALRQQLEVTNDDEWKIIGDQVLKVYNNVTKSQSSTMNVTSLLRLAMGAGMGGGNANGGFGNRGGRGGGGGGMGALFGNQDPDPEMEALQRAIDSKASASDLRAAINKVQDSRKQRQAALLKSQSDLRQLLSVRQEAILCSMGLL